MSACQVLWGREKRGVTTDGCGFLMGVTECSGNSMAVMVAQHRKYKNHRTVPL